MRHMARAQTGSANVWECARARPLTSWRLSGEPPFTQLAWTLRAEPAQRVSRWACYPIIALVVLHNPICIMSKPEEKKEKKPLIKFGPFEQAIGVLLFMGWGALRCGSLCRALMSQRAYPSREPVLASCAPLATGRWRMGRSCLWAQRRYLNGHPALHSAANVPRVHSVPGILHLAAARGRAQQAESPRESRVQVFLVVLLFKVVVVVFLLVQGNELKRCPRQGHAEQ